MKKVSIIIPVYNVENYLEECLDSLINQTYSNCEIILIDDGSKDKSPIICDNYQEKYYNIVVFHIANNGVSNARNLGIEKSTGDYLTFVDSDDFIEPTTIESVVKALEENDVDLVSYGYNYAYKDKKIPSSFNGSKILTQQETKEGLFKNDSIRGFSCNKLYKKELIDKKNIRFEKEIKICEDLLFNFEYCQDIRNSYKLDLPFYNYRMRKSSASNKDNERDLTVFKALNKMHSLDENLYNYIGNFYSYIYFKYYKMLKKTNSLDKVHKLSVLSTLKNKQVSKKTKIYCLAYRYLPKFIKTKLKSKKQDNNVYYE